MAFVLSAVVPLLAVGVWGALGGFVVGGCGLCLMVLGALAMSERSLLRGSTTFLAGAGFLAGGLMLWGVL